MLDAPIPKELTEIQTWFAQHITAPIRESDSASIPLFPDNLIDEIRERIAPGPHLTSEERLGVYQQQYWWRLLSICQEIFPTLIRLFGYEDFNHLIAEPYLLKYPPNDWFLSNLGANLPKWVQKCYRAKDASIVLRLAELDLAYEQLLFTDIESLKLSACEKKTLFLQPSVLLFEFEVDLFAFRSQLLEHPPEHWETNDFPPFNKNGKKRYFVLFRELEKSIYEEISCEFFALLSRFKKGARLTDLVPFLEQFDGVFKSFQLMAKRGWLTSSCPESNDPTK